MDFANSICKPRNPNCESCPISRSCLSLKLGEAENIPVRPIKRNIPIRTGYVFFIKVKPNKFLLERRPSEGILGGLLGFPTTEWEVIKNKPTLPLKANWTFTKRLVTHQFSHFKLELEIVLGEKGNNEFDSSKYLAVEQQNFDLMSLPTLMRKVYTKAIKL